MNRILIAGFVALALASFSIGAAVAIYTHATREEPNSLAIPEPQTNPIEVTESLAVSIAMSQPQSRPSAISGPSPLGTVPMNHPIAINDTHEALTDRETVFDALVMPFVNEAQRRRGERRKSDPAYAKRIDKELNEGRVNFLLFGYGETHEPPATEKAIIGSVTIVSFNYRTGKADLISLTHDIRAPEIERALDRRGQKTSPVRMDQAYFVGGFPLMREVLEDATGLAIDFQVVFKDAAIRDLIDQVFGGIEIVSPSEFQVQPFYLDGKKYPTGFFSRGRQTLSGVQVIQFIKTVPVAEGAYAKTLEHNARKHIVFQALLESIQRNRASREFWLRSTAFIARAIGSGAIAYDFDPIPLMIHNPGNISSGLSEWIAYEKAAGSHMPKIKKMLYIVDPAHGDGGVQWVNANARVNPITKRDIEKGVYPSLDLAIPLNANPYGDLVTQYWTSVRALVKKSLLEKGPG